MGHIIKFWAVYCFVFQSWLMTIMVIKLYNAAQQEDTEETNMHIVFDSCSKELLQACFSIHHVTDDYRQNNMLFVSIRGKHCASYLSVCPVSLWVQLCCLTLTIHLLSVSLFYWTVNGSVYELSKWSDSEVVWCEGNTVLHLWPTALLCTEPILLAGLHPLLLCSSCSQKMFYSLHWSRTWEGPNSDSCDQLWPSTVRCCWSARFSWGTTSTGTCTVYHHITSYCLIMSSAWSRHVF